MWLIEEWNCERSMAHQDTVGSLLVGKFVRNADNVETYN